jgi:hypothetical protein
MRKKLGSRKVSNGLSGKIMNRPFVVSSTQMI